MARPRFDYEVFRNVMTMIGYMLAGVAVCAGIVGILYGAGVVVMHWGDGKDCNVVNPSLDTAAKPPAAIVYRHAVDLTVMFAKLKVKDDKGALYQNYQITMFKGDDTTGTPTLTANLAAAVAKPSHEISKDLLTACPNIGGKNPA
eukprot:259280_1